MGMFKMREPRKFNHKYIFVDERKEKLEKIVEKAKRDLGMLPPREERDIANVCKVLSRPRIPMLRVERQMERV